MFNNACKIVAILGLTIGIISCKSSKTPIEFSKDTEEIWMRINDNAIATNDTVLWLRISGQDLAWMKLSHYRDSLDIPWIPFDTLTIMKAPHVEGIYTVYGMFKFINGDVTEVISDEIILDFTAEIFQISVEVEVDTLRPGDWIEFTMDTGESGNASIKFGTLFQELTLRPDRDGLFNDILIIPRIVKHENANIIASFTDIAGNVASSMEHETTYPIRGAELSPRVVGRVELGEFRSNDIWYSQGYCYISAYNTVHIVNVIDKSNPVLIEPIDSNVYNVGLSGFSDLLLITDFTYGVSVYNIQNPDMPVKLGRTIVWGNAKDVVVTDNIAYVSSELNGLFVINMQSPSNPERIIRLPLNCTGESICFNDSLVYIAGSNGIAIVSVSDPFEPKVLSQFNGINFDVKEVIYHNGNLLLATWESGLIRINVEDPFHPFFVQRYHHLDNSTDLFIDNPFLFVTRGEVLSIVNLSNLDELPILEDVSDLDFAQSLYVRDGLVFVAEINSLTVIELVPPN